jgi:threonine dehydratase
MEVTTKQFEEASQTLKQILSPTSLVKNHWLSEKYGCNVFLKLETLQPVGSFKLRGATNKISKLTKDEKKRGVLAVSAGNHAQGVAWAASKYDCKATIIMPKNSPLTKIMNTEALGAKVELVGENVEAGFEHAKKVLDNEGLCYVHPFKDPLIIAGQGTIAYELLEQMSDPIDFVIGSVGGGGLLAGVGSVFKEKSPETKVIGVQASGASSMVQSLQEGKITNTGHSDTFADGIRVATADEEMFKILDKVVDEALHVSDQKIAAAILELIERARVITEGAGAITLAAFDELYNLNPRRFKGKNIVLLICGGNIDVNLIDQIIDRGLIATQRRAKIEVHLPDSPGSLGKLTTEISDHGANILEVTHNREAPHLKLKESIVEVTMETKGKEHLDEILNYLNENYGVVSNHNEIGVG